MPKPRNIDPTFWDDPDVAVLTRDERLLFIGMITLLADDQGRMLADPGYIRKRVFGYDDDVTRAQVEGWRNDIVKKCRNVILYAAGAQHYIAFANWERYQKMRYAIESKLPPPPVNAPKDAQVTELSGTLLEFPVNSPRVELSRVKDELGSANTGEPVESVPPAKDDNFKAFFDELWELYPTNTDNKKPKKAEMERLARKIPARDWDLVLTAVENYCQADKVIRGFVKEPPGFLKDSYWRDYIEPVKPAAGKSNTNGIKPNLSDPDVAAKYTEGPYASMFNQGKQP